MLHRKHLDDSHQLGFFLFQYFDQDFYRLATTEEKAREIHEEFPKWKMTRVWLNLHEARSLAASILGSEKNPKRAAASRANASKPPKEGSNPRGRPRKVSVAPLLVEPSEPPVTAIVKPEKKLANRKHIKGQPDLSVSDPTLF